MPPTVHQEKWVKDLPDGFKMYKVLNTLLGKVVGFSVVLTKDGEGITRYDTAHDYVHRDVLGRKRPGKVLDKKWYPQMSYSDGFNFADADFEKNYNEYYAFYENH